VRPAARGVRAGAQGASRGGPVAQEQPGWPEAGSCGDDGAINVWELESGKHLRTLRRDRPYERLDISGVKGLTDAQRSTLRALGSIEKGATSRVTE
jgi:hypothetical protein